MTLVLADDALRAYVRLTIVAKIFGLLLRMHEAEFVNEAFFTIIAGSLPWLCLIVLVRVSAVNRWTQAAKIISFLLVVYVVCNFKISSQKLRRKNAIAETEESLTKYCEVTN